MMIKASNVLILDEPTDHLDMKIHHSAQQRPDQIPGSDPVRVQGPSDRADYRKPYYGNSSQRHAY